MALGFRKTVGIGKFLYAPWKTRLQISFRYTADVREAGIHGDVLEVVETAENAEFAYLGDAGEERELEESVLVFDYLVEALEHPAVGVGQRFVVKIVYDGLVVFVDEEHDGAAGLRPNRVNDILPRYRSLRIGPPIS